MSDGEGQRFTIWAKGRWVPLEWRPLPSGNSAFRKRRDNASQHTEHSATRHGTAPNRAAHKNSAQCHQTRHSTKQGAGTRGRTAWHGTDTAARHHTTQEDNKTLHNGHPTPYQEQHNKVGASSNETPQNAHQSGTARQSCTAQGTTKA